ncbi:P-loop containing nucleoside triphosphate hydrolase protein [Biscogniauxia sp. FL1348]|nr:P-loop containing nucleoside triphosphate hydrolase protein [Biscogniauxia sp. FL1348]
MADPPSIAASVAGLLGLSGAIHTQISGLVQQYRDVPQSAHQLLLAVSETRMVVASMSELVDGQMQCLPRRRAMVQIDHLILALTQTVMTMSEIEQFLVHWSVLYDPKRSRYWRIRLVAVENKANKLVERLKGNVASMSLVLNILQCESDIDAQNDRTALYEALGSALPEIQGQLCRRSTVYSQGRLSTINHGPSVPRAPLMPTQRQSIDKVAGQVQVVTLQRRSFESVLNRTRVYARVRGDTSENMSLLTDGQMVQSWNMFPGISLNDIALSQLSAYALPITLQEIANSSWYRQNLWRGLQNNIFKIAVLGDGGVGKSTLISKLCYDTYTNEYDATIEDQHSIHTTVDRQVCRIDITDSPGTYGYDELLSDEILAADGFLILFSVTCERSFELVRDYHTHIMRTKTTNYVRGTLPIIIVGTKADVPAADRQVKRHMGWSLASELGCDYAECSAKNGSEYEVPFHDIVRGLRMMRGR